jgi:hypothetical protein
MRASRVELGMLFRYDPAYIQVVQRAMSTRHLGGQNIVRFITVSSNCAIWRTGYLTVIELACHVELTPGVRMQVVAVLFYASFWLLVEPSCNVKLTPGGRIP